MSTDLQSTIEAAWDARDTLGLTTTGAVREAVETAIAGLDDVSFQVSLIPTTLALTTLGTKQVGEPVNLEVDVLAKYVERLLGEPR